MSTTFYRLWLPVSLVAHVLLLLVLGVIKLPPVKAAAIETIFVSIFADPPADEPWELAPHPDRPLPPPIVPTTTWAVRKGVEAPSQAHGTDPKDGVVKVPNGLGGDSTAKGPGEGRKAPPALLTSPTGRWGVPPGVPNGTGTGRGTETGDDGPSYGIAASGGPTQGYSKSAGELNQNGRVAILVQVSSGDAPSFRVTESSGSDALDREALALARRWDFKAAMKQGVPVAGTLRMQVNFTHGQFFVEVVQ
ncbi:MAG TPA: energy transducer TonB [Armatimonadota bacterium]|nr:energy transducer TonB [Armatimonadota bacterium]HOS42604.1 energy transducer TonB [Armatimonadota bacterium]